MTATRRTFGTAAAVLLGVGLGVGPAGPAPDAQAAVPAAAPTAAPTSTQASTCSGAKRPGRVVVVRGMPATTRSAARALLASGVRCDARALTKRAARDKTRLSFGIVTAEEFFALPEKETKYRYLVDALAKARPGYEKVSRDYVWPRVAAGDGYKDPAAWDEAVAAGLLTKDQAARMRRDGSGYLGWRIGVSDRGEWDFFIAGD